MNVLQEKVSLTLTVFKSQKSARVDFPRFPK